MFNFVLFCIHIISFFKKEEDLVSVANHLLNCLDGNILLRDHYEIIMRIIIFEAQNRNLNLYECLSIIKNDEYLQPDVFIYEPCGLSMDS